MKKKAVKITLIILGTVLFAVLTFTGYCLAITANVKLDKNKLVNMNSSVEVFDKNGESIEEWSGGKSITVAGELHDYTLNAFVAIEDKRFYSHHGTDFKGFMRAAFNNLKSFSFKEGASTISQQLIKNTHLSGEKTLKRKLSEIKLAKQLEKNYSKKEILEMYVNTIYFGDGCYGITRAANNYFGVSPSDLTVNQSAALAAIIKAPALYSPKISPKNCNARKNLVLKEMYEQNYISKEEYDKDIKQDVHTTESENDIDSPYLQLVKTELYGLLDKTAYSKTKIKVYTYYNKNIQQDIEKAVENFDLNTDKKAIVLNNQNKIQAFYSTCGDIPRQLGSTIKPIAVYAPAVDMGEIDSCTPILDEKINIDGYAPSNYKDVYYGYVSAKFALNKSLNSCAVKILNDCGTDNCLKYLKKTDIPVCNSDATLCLALGATEKGATLYELSAAYGAFINKGLYIKPGVIEKICLENGKTVYSDDSAPKRIYGEDTAFIMNDMLKNTVKEGTAKTLSSLKLPLAAKTGTVGNENGNTDAYSISYTGDYIVSVWVGNADGALMDNSVSGGTVPTKICFNVWNNMLKSGYKANDTFDSDKVKSVAIDKISYEQNHVVEIADEYFPERYIMNEYFKVEKIPKKVSTRFSLPIINNAEISLNGSAVNIKLSMPEYCDYKIYRECDKVKIQVFDSAGKKDKSKFSDKHLMPNTVYKYSLIPYISGKNGIKTGEEYKLKEIKTPPVKYIGDDWWQDFYLELDFGFN